MSPAAPFLVHSLGVALLLFCLQGTMIWGVAAAALAALRRATPESRYLVALLALTCCPATFVLTLLGVLRDGPIVAAGTSLNPFGQAAAVAPLAVLAAATTLPLRIADWLPQSWAQALSIGWGAGASLVGVRFGLAWLWISRRLRRESTPLGPAWARLAEHHARRLGIATRIRLVAWPSARSPFVVGWVRPIVVFPVSVIAGLPANQVELLLLHELFHIRRADTFANQLQLVAETVFFFHPGVRWISRHVRIERELCCDAAVCRVTGASFDYAEALARTAGAGQALPRPVVAASGGVLARRIRALLQPAAPARSSLQAAGSVAALLLATLGWTWPYPRAADARQSGVELLASVEAGPLVPLEFHSRRIESGPLSWQVFACPDTARLTTMTMGTWPYRLRIAARGALTPRPDLLAADGADRRAAFVIDEATWSGVRRYVMRRSGDAAAVWTVSDRGRPERAATPRDLDHATRLLNGLWTRTSFLAAERGRRAGQHGAAALDRAVVRVHDDFARAEMLIAVHATRGHGRPVDADLVRLAAARVGSSVELARTLHAMAPSGTSMRSTWRAWITATRRIAAPAERERVLCEVAARLPDEWVPAFLAEADRLPAEGRAAVLRSWARRRT